MTTNNQTTIDELYRWPICGNCAETLADEDLEYCDQCGKRLDSAMEAVDQ